MIVKLHLYPTQHADKVTTSGRQGYMHKHRVLVQVQTRLKTVEHAILLKVENEDFDKI